MKFELIRRTFLGLGFSAIFIFGAITILMLQEIQVPISELWKNIAGSMIMGIYFGNASLIFETENWSPLKQTLIHFFVSLAVWFPLAIFMGWLPVDFLFILIGIGIFCVIYLLFWSGAYVYYKQQAMELNNATKKS